MLNFFISRASATPHARFYVSISHHPTPVALPPTPDARYTNALEAAKAIDELNNTELDGRPLFVRPDREDFTIKRPGGPGGAFSRGRGAYGAGGGHPGGGMHGHQGGMHGHQGGMPMQHQQQGHPGVHGIHGGHGAPHHQGQGQFAGRPHHVTTRPGAQAGCKVYVGNLPFEVQWHEVCALAREFFFFFFFLCFFFSSAGVDIDGALHLFFFFPLHFNRG
jgi:hypothetical protein